MRTVKISEAKAKFSAHIEYVKRGNEILILDRETPVARLMPVESAADGDGQMKRLFAKGLVVPARDPHNRAGFKPSPAGDRPIPQHVVDRIWEEEREGR
jgi:prevent-host-death family protein